MGIAIVTAIVLGLLAREVWAYLPWFQHALLELATALLPATERAMRLEEWHAYLLEFPGELTRTSLALDCLRAGATYRARVTWDFLKAKVLRYVPIVDERDFQRALRLDLHAMVEAHEAGIITIEDIREHEWLVHGRKHLLVSLIATLNDARYKSLRDLPGTSHAWDSWQWSAPVKLLRRAYSHLKYGTKK